MIGMLAFGAASPGTLIALRALRRCIVHRSVQRLPKGAHPRAPETAIDAALQWKWRVAGACCRGRTIPSVTVTAVHYDEDR